MLNCIEGFYKYFKFEFKKLWPHCVTHMYNLCQPNKGQVTSRVKFQSLIKPRKKTPCKPTSCEKSNPEIFAFFLKICQKLLCIQQLSHFTFYLPTAVSTYLIKM